MKRGGMGAPVDIYQTTHSHPIEVLDARNVRVSLEDARRVLNVGETLLVRYEVYAPDVIHFSGTRNATVRNVRIFCHPGMGVTGADSEDIFIDNLRVQPRERQWMSTTADATHFNNCRGRIDIRNSVFENMGDDATNVHQMYWVIAEKENPRALRVKFGRDNGEYLPTDQLPRVGDRIEFGARANWLRPSSTAEVVGVETDRSGKTALVRFARDVPEYASVGMPLWNASAQPTLTIENCAVRNNRARGFLIKTATASVKNCVFEHTTLPGILLENDNNYWFEGAAVASLTVENCVFTGCGFWMPKRGAIFDAVEFGKGTPQEGFVNNCARITGCEFTQSGQEPVQLRRTRAVTMENNRVNP